jgi:hypothetical protein
VLEIACEHAAGLLTIAPATLCPISDDQTGHAYSSRKIKSGRFSITGTSEPGLTPGKVKITGRLRGKWSSPASVDTRG